MNYSTSLAFACLATPAILPAQAPDDSAKRFALAAYAAITYSHYNWDTDRHRRATIDLERLVVEGTYRLTPRIGFEAEVEFEHGGTGSALDFDPSGASTKFETEIEKSGEIVLEELHATFQLRRGLNLRVGHFYVPMGWLSSKYTPLEYPTVTRPDMEVSLIPAQWDETGVKLMGRTSRVRYQVGVVNGLDNSAFGSATWIVPGKQRRFEHVRAENVAGIARVDLVPLRGLVAGASCYVGNSTGNRPMADLDLPAYVTVVDGHADFERDGWRARGLFLYGWLQNSAAVSNANALSVAGTPVGSAAMGWSLEAGYDMLRLVEAATRSPGADGLDLFGRYEFYDSMHRVAAGISDDPRWERRQWTVGLNYRIRDHLVFKGQYADRTLGLAQNNHERTVSAGIGAQF
jgi:hypothetical protein